MTKAEQLIQGLQEGERLRFSDVIKNHKRSSLALLYTYILSRIRKNQHLDKKKAFIKVFGRVYSAKEDYLLRNELRLLVQEVEEFLIQEEITTECKTDPNFRDTMLLRSLLKHHCFNELEHLYPTCYVSSIEHLNFEQARRQSDIYFQYLVFHRKIDPTILRQGWELMMEQLRVLKIQYRTNAMLNQNSRAMCQAALAMSNQVLPHPISPLLDTDFSEAETPYILYIESILKAQIETDMEKRLLLAQESVEHISKVQHIYRVEKQLALATLATLHYIKSDYSSARSVFEEALRYVRDSGLPLNINVVELLHNYVGSLIRLGEYTQALTVMDEYRHLLDKHEKLVLRFHGFRCFCYIFLRQPEQAFAAIPHGVPITVEYERLYFRFIYSVIPYLRGDIETAYRESINLGDYFARHEDTSSFPEQGSAAACLKKFYACVASTPDKRRTKLYRLEKELEALHIHSPKATDNFFMIWLRNEISSLLDQSSTPI